MGQEGPVVYGVAPLLSSLWLFHFSGSRGCTCPPLPFVGGPADARVPRSLLTVCPTRWHPLGRAPCAVALRLLCCLTGGDVQTTLSGRPTFCAHRQWARNGRPGGLRRLPNDSPVSDGDPAGQLLFLRLRHPPASPRVLPMPVRHSFLPLLTWAGWGPLGHTEHSRWALASLIERPMLC